MASPASVVRHSVGLKLTLWTLIPSATLAALLLTVLDDAGRHGTLDHATGRLLYVLAVAVALIPPAIVWLAAGGLVRSLGQVRAAEATVAGGDLNVSVPVTSSDELGDLAAGFNDMTRALSGTFAELERRLDHRTRQLATLNAIAAVASQSLDLDAILPEALDKTLEVMGLEAGIVFRLEPESQVLVAVAARGMSQGLMRRVTRLALEESTAAQAAIEGQPAIHWVKDYPPGPVRNNLMAAGLVQVVSLPLMAQGQLLGAMNLATGIERALSESERGTLAGIGRQIGVAMANARLLEEAQRAATIEERQRLARELHDSVTQSLYSLTLLAEAGRRLALEGEPQSLSETLGRIGETAQYALKEMRLLVYELRPLELEHEGLVGALRRRLNAVERRSGIKARLTLDGEIDVPAPMEAELYRIVQEVLNNTLKHAQATEVNVHLVASPNLITLDVADNGRGFDPGAVAGRGGLGLSSMRERAERLGAWLTVDSAPGGGTHVRVEVPLQ